MYWIATEVRNWFFEIGVLRVTRLTVPVISVGNISVGGSGKTPFVSVLAQKLEARNRKPAVVSRGYGRKSKGYVVVANRGEMLADVVAAGDEPVELAQCLKNVAVVVDENRVEGAGRATTELGSDAILLDDGFQHRYLHRDLNIVLVTAKDAVRRDWLLPAGNRRETLKSLKRADLLVISKCQSRQEYDDAVRKFPDWPSDRIAGFRFVPVALRRVAGRDCLDRQSAHHVPVVLFSGIGDPASFRLSVSEFGCDVVKSLEFGDHHWYSTSDLLKVRTSLGETEAKLLVTTQKDVTRLHAKKNEGDSFLKDLPVYVLEIVPEFIAGEEKLDRFVEGVIR